MGKLKIIETVLAAISALVTAAKSVISFIRYIIKLRDKLADSTA